MSDPSLLVTRPTAGDPRWRRPGRDLLYVLAPAPNLARGKVDWDNTGHRLPAEHDRHRHAPDCPRSVTKLEVLHVVNPADWARQGMVAGTPFALAHTFAQTGPFRPANMVRGVDNVVLAGSSTVPGVGVPTALLSGRLAADRITGSSGRRTTAAPRGGLGMIGSELDAAGVHDPDLRAAYRHCRDAECPAWPDVLPGHPATRPRAAARGARALRLRAAWPTTSSTISTPTSASTSAATALQRLAHSSRRARRNARRRRAPVLTALVAHRAPLPTSTLDSSTTSSAPCGWTSPSPTIRTAPPWSGTSTVRPRSSGCNCCRCSAPSVPSTTPRHTPQRSERRSSSPTSCAMSTRICAAAGSICPPTSSPLTASTATC